MLPSLVILSEAKDLVASLTCHPERSEGSGSMGSATLRFRLMPIIVVLPTLTGFSTIQTKQLKVKNLNLFQQKELKTWQ